MKNELKEIHNSIGTIAEYCEMIKNQTNHLFDELMQLELDIEQQTYTRDIFR